MPVPCPAAVAGTGFGHSVSQGNGMRGWPSSCHHHLPDPLLQVSKVPQSHQTPSRGEDTWSSSPAGRAPRWKWLTFAGTRSATKVGLRGSRGRGAQRLPRHGTSNYISCVPQRAAGSWAALFPEPSFGPAALRWHQPGPGLALGWPRSLRPQEGQWPHLRTQDGLAQPGWKLPSGQEMLARVWGSSDGLVVSIPPSRPWPGSYWVPHGL